MIKKMWKVPLWKWFLGLLGLILEIKLYSEGYLGRAVGPAVIGLIFLLFWKVPLWKWLLGLLGLILEIKLYSEGYHGRAVGSAVIGLIFLLFWGLLTLYIKWDDKKYRNRNVEGKPITTKSIDLNASKEKRRNSKSSHKRR